MSEDGMWENEIWETINYTLSDLLHAHLIAKYTTQSMAQKKSNNTVGAMEVSVCDWFF